jgi:catalase
MPLSCALQEDYHLTEKLAQFDRERIPERVVHARGAAAKGFFEVTHDISHLSCADVFRAPGVQVRQHRLGSPDACVDCCPMCCSCDACS